MIVQDDKAPSHIHHAQAVVYIKKKVERLLWCGNSTVIKMIEPARPQLKRATTKKGATKTREVAEKSRLEDWDELEQEI